jgi:hypothetical protein
LHRQAAAGALHQPAHTLEAAASVAGFIEIVG